MSFVRESVIVGGKPMTFETGRLAKQAHGSVLITYGETMVLVTAVSQEERPGLDFFPLTCEFVEKTYAAGKIPGGFFKREARQREEEILTCRIMDRPLRPLFPDGFKKDTRSSPPSSAATSRTRQTSCRSPPPAARCTSPTSPGTAPSPACAWAASAVSSSPTRPSRHREVRHRPGGRLLARRHCHGRGRRRRGHRERDRRRADVRPPAAQPIIDLTRRIRARGQAEEGFTAPALDQKIAKRIAEVADKELALAVLVKDKRALRGYSVLKKRVGEILLAEMGRRPSCSARS